MSSPASRRSSQRNSQSGTPNRSLRSSSQQQPAARSSPAVAEAPPPPSSSRRATPRTTRSSQLASSPMFYQSSSPVNGHVNGTAATNGVANPGVHVQPPSSPLRQTTDSQSQSAGNRTPRASGAGIGESSPIRYDASSSPGRNAAGAHQQSDLRSESSGLFVDSRLPGPGSRSAAAAASSLRRGDIHSEGLARTPRAARRVILDEAGRVVREEAVAGGPPAGSDAPSFDVNNPDTSEANALGGQSQSLIWGTTVSIDDTFAAFKDFLRNFTRKYRMWLDGMTEADTDALGRDAQARPYHDAMENMLLLGTTRLYLDICDLKAYPRTQKLWHQVQAYPQEVVPIMDQAVHDMMMELARAEMAKQQKLGSAAVGVGAGSAGAGAGATAPPPPSSSQQTSQQTTLATASQGSAAAFPSSERSEEVQQQQQAAASSSSAAHRPPVASSTLEDQVSDMIYVVRPYGLDRSTNLRELNPADMDRLISIKGLVIRTTPVIPDMKDAFFKCSACNHSVNVSLDRGKIREPTECPRPRCATKNSMQIVHNRCSFEDKQVIKLQETPDEMPAGQTPHAVSVCVYNELVDFCKAGDRVQLTGIFRVSPVRVNPRQRTIKSVYKTYVDVLHVQKVDAKRLGADTSTLHPDLPLPSEGGREGEEEEEEAEGVAAAAAAAAGAEGLRETRTWTAEEEEKIKATGARPDVYDLLARSLAPSIYEMDDVKKGVLLQLFGGTNKSFTKGGSPKYRGDINVLLCGDPSTSKSQMLAYVHKIAPRGVYTSGKGSSAVGLTAYVARDPETRQLVLESGALVLSDGGVCCIDEFDKMSDATRSVLHEVMEQQTVSVAKAGIITTLNARTSVLASANPIGSRYNPDLPVPQNIDLPPTLLSRFDLVYLILDRADEKTDRRLAKHLLSMYLEDSPQSAASKEEMLPVEFLTSYISYARTRIHPVLTDAASRELIEAYVEMRRLGQDARAAEKRITATTRQLESMIRLAEAHAKTRLSRTVEPDDVREASRLIRAALKTAATDANGRIDMSLLTDAASSADRRRRADLQNAVLRLLDEAPARPLRYADLARRLADAAGVPLDPADLAESLRSLENAGSVTINGDGPRRSVRRVAAAA